MGELTRDMRRRRWCQCQCMSPDPQKRRMSESSGKEQTWSYSLFPYRATRLLRAREGRKRNRGSTEVEVTASEALILNGVGLEWKWSEPFLGSSGRWGDF